MRCFSYRSSRFGFFKFTHEVFVVNPLRGIFLFEVGDGVPNIGNLFRRQRWVLGHRGKHGNHLAIGGDANRPRRTPGDCG